MHGTTTRKVGRLAAYLATHPAAIPSYLTQSLPKSKSPIALEVPWVSFSAIRFLRGFVKPQHRVAEFGGGGSTLFFARRAEHVHCIESNQEWAQRIREAAAGRDLANIDLEVFPFDCNDAAAFEQSPYLNRLRPEGYDIILVDGYEEDVPLRPTCFARAENHIRAGGVIVVDDAWRYPQLRTNNRAQRWKEFRSTGPCRPGVTTTDVYFY